MRLLPIMDNAQRSPAERTWIACKSSLSSSTVEPKALLVQALEQQLEPDAINLGETVSAKISVDVVQLSKLTRLAKTRINHLTPQEVAIRLIHQMHQSQQNMARRGTINHTLEKLIAAGVVTHRPGQGVSVVTMRGALTSKGVLMMEAPTGIGKTMVELCSAVDALMQNPSELVVIAVPAIHLMHQIEREYEKIQSILGDEAPDIGYVVGRDKFVSLDALNAIIEDPDYDQEKAKIAKEWIKRAKLTGETISELPYQIESLQEDLPDMPPCTLDSTTSEDDPGMRAYRAQFSRAKEVGILVVTHSMLALDTKLKRIKASKAAKENGDDAAALRDVHNELVKNGTEEEKGFYSYLNEVYSEYEVEGVLPTIHRLVVDEGHLLEKAFASMTCDDISIFSLSHNKSFSKKSTGELKILFQKLVELGASLQNREQIVIGDSDPAIEILMQINKILSSTKKKDAAIKKTQAVISSILKQPKRPGYLSVMEYSPIHTYPRIRTGAQSVFMYLQYLWKSIRSGAVISATLLLPSSQGGWSASYTTRLLGVPTDLVKTAHISAPEWLTSPAVVCMPKQVDLGARFWLQPPSMPKDMSNKDSNERYERDTETWTDEVTSILHNVILTAKGGTLVLLSSYALANALHKQLGAHAGRLVVAKRGISQAEQVRQYKEIYARGKDTEQYPVWLAVGGAWTGLNLVDDMVAPEDDRMLTDLVIPRLPMGMNQSFTHEARVSALGWTMEYSEVLLLLKQGLGRLVRRENVEKIRRIFILDTRLYDRNKFAALFNGVERITAPYRKVEIQKD